MGLHRQVLFEIIVICCIKFKVFLSVSIDLLFVVD